MRPRSGGEGGACSPGARLAGGKAPAGCHRNKIPRFHGNCISAGSYRCHLAAGPRRLPHALVPRTAEHRRSAASSRSSCCPVTAPSLPHSPWPHSREQVRPGTEPPPSLTRFAGSLCSAEGSSLAYPEAREPRDDVQSSGALGQRLTCPGPGCSASLPREAQPAAAADTAFHCKHRQAQHLLSDHHLVSHAQRHLSVAIQREPLFAGAHTPSSHVPEGPGQHQPMGHVQHSPARPARAPRGEAAAHGTSHISHLTPCFPPRGSCRCSLPS